MSERIFPVSLEDVPQEYHPKLLPCCGEYLYILWHDPNQFPGNADPKYICAYLDNLSQYGLSRSGCDLNYCPVTKGVPQPQLAEITSFAIRIVKDSWNYDPESSDVITVSELFDKAG